MSKTIITAVAFDGMDSKRIRFIHEISTYGQIDVLLLSDALIHDITGNNPKFPEPERRYFLESIRYVRDVHTIDDLSRLQKISDIVSTPVGMWMSLDLELFNGCENYARQQGVDYKLFTATVLNGYPEHDYDLSESSNKKVIVTGCYDWFHTGHIRFFEEASEYGDLYVALGHDKNLEKLKGPGHPMFNTAGNLDRNPGQ